MYRVASADLDRWLHGKIRKPLVLRGARQVGKTWLVRDFAKRNGLELVELNLERFPNLADLFSENRPSEIIRNIEAELSTTIDPQTALLFLDEIQAVPELFSKLRWFKEEMPRLPVIAAGSLLEFALKKYQYSMPVGRVTYFYLEQMSFFEFILALGHEPLYKKLLSFRMNQGFPSSLHEKCLQLFNEFCLVGGMPEVVSEWCDTRCLKSCIKIQHDLLSTYRDDFHKYGGEADARLLAKIILSVSRQLGNKFIYSRVDPSRQVAPVKTAFTLLSQAKVCSKVIHTTGNGLPLGAESNEKFFKTLMLDIGLISVQLGLSSIKPSEINEVVLSSKGGLAEQFVGQQLRAAQAPLADPQLYYWQRTGGRLGEIDYVIQHGNKVVPIEVKSGAAGSMKSLHQFMAEKNLDLAVRCNLNLPVVEKIQVKTTRGQPVSYLLISVPVYLAARLEKIIAQVQHEGGFNRTE